MANAVPSRDVIAGLTSTTRFRTLVTILVASQVIDDLRAAGPWLVLAPPDDAFDGLDASLLACWLRPSGVESLVDLAENHVVRAPRASLRAAPRSGSFRSLLGEKVTLGRREGARSAHAGILAWRAYGNGAVAVVDRVLLPSSLRSSHRRGVVLPPTPSASERSESAASGEHSSCEAFLQ